MASSLKPQQISARTEKWIRFSAIAVMFIVAVASMVLSFDGLRKLATEAKISEQLAFLFPVIVDGTIIMASLAILRMNLSGQRAVLGWVTMFLGTGLSIAGNVISVRNEGVIAMGTHALPPILLATSLELFLSLIRTNIKLAQDAQDAAELVHAASQESTQPASAPIEAIVAETVMPVNQPSTPSVNNEPANLDSAPTVNKEEEKLPDREPVAIGESPNLPAAVEAEYPKELVASPEPEQQEIAVAEEEESKEIPVPKIVFETVFEPAQAEEATPFESPQDSVPESKVQQEHTTVDATKEVSVVLPVEQITVEEESVNNLAPTSKEDNGTAPEVETPVEVPAEPVKKPVAPKAKPDNEQVVNYKKILERLKPETKKHIKIAAILSRFPDAKPVDIKRAMGDPANARYSEDIQQAKAFLVQRAQQKQKS